MPYIKINQIQPNPNQPRKLIDEESLKELSASIKVDGLFNPITVRALKNNEFQIVHGERRWRATKKAGLEEIEVKIIKADDERTFVLGLIENLQRKNLNAYEEMKAFKELVDKGWTQNKIAKTISKTQSYVAQKLRLAQLPLSVLVIVKDGTLSEGSARQLLKIKGFIDRYKVVPFTDWKYGGKPPVNLNPDKHWYPYHWTEFYQDQIAWHNYKKPVTVIKEAVDRLRFDFWFASTVRMPTEAEEKKWLENRNYPYYKLIKKIANPILKKEHELEESEWAFAYGIKHKILVDVDDCVT